jgi:hypothetical protein
MAAVLLGSGVKAQGVPPGFVCALQQTRPQARGATVAIDAIMKCVAPVSGIALTVQLFFRQAGSTGAFGGPFTLVASNVSPDLQPPDAAGERRKTVASPCGCINAECSARARFGEYVARIGTLIRASDGNFLVDQNGNKAGVGFTETVRFDCGSASTPSPVPPPAPIPPLNPADIPTMSPFPECPTIRDVDVLPLVEDRTEQDASIILLTNGFSPGDVTKQPSQKPAGLVITGSLRPLSPPQAGMVPEKCARVFDLVVSQGSFAFVDDNQFECLEPSDPRLNGRDGMPLPRCGGSLGMTGAACSQQNEKASCRQVVDIDCFGKEPKTMGLRQLTCRLGAPNRVSDVVDIFNVILPVLLE